MKTVSRLYARLYDLLCGVHPRRYPWHAQWLSVKDLYRNLRRVLGTLEGRVLDVGCRNKPYAHWLTRATQHVGADIVGGPHVDFVIREGERWPIPDANFQAVVCTQVIQHVSDFRSFLAEIDRVLAPNGVAVLSFPFLYHDMSVTYDGCAIKDRWRYSVHAARELFPASYEVIEAGAQGGIGSTLGMLWLNWVTATAASNRVTEILFMLALPLWIPVCVLVNTAGLIADKIDRSAIFYHDVLLVVRKKSA